MKIEFLLADITKIKVEAIVNASDRKLSGGGGIDKAIHKAAGPQIKEVLKDKSIEVGEAIITPGFNLPAKYVVHTCGPRYRDGRSGEGSKLRKAYISCLEEAKKEGIKSIAFCSLSTGVFRYPLDEAAPIAVSAILEWKKENKSDIDVSFAFLDTRTKSAYERALQAVIDKENEAKTPKKTFISEYEVGDKVIHKKFGAGIVSGIENKESDAILEIEFEHEVKALSENACRSLKLLKRG